MSDTMPTTPEAANDRPGQRSVADLEKRKLQIEADPDFLKGDRESPKHQLLVKDWNEVFNKLAERESTPAAPAPEPAPVPLVALALPEGKTLTADETRAVNAAVAAMQEVGMAPDETGRWLHYIAEQVQADPPDATETEQTLRQEWGDEFDQKFLAARLATQRLGRAFQQFLNATELGNDVRVIKRMASLGASLVPVAKRKREIERDPDFLSKFKNPARNAALVKEWNEVFARLNSRE